MTDAKKDASKPFDAASQKKPPKTIDRSSPATMPPLAQDDIQAPPATPPFFGVFK